MRAWLEETIAQHTGRDVEQVRKDIERDKILSAAAAKEYGLIDEVLLSRKDSLSTLTHRLRQHADERSAPERRGAALIRYRRATTLPLRCPPRAERANEECDAARSARVIGADGRSDR